MLIYRMSVKKNSARSKMFVECMVCFGDLDGASSSSSSSSSSQSVPLILEASPNTKKLKRACIERF